MSLRARKQGKTALLLLVSAGLAAAGLSGCASPGPPRPPSLQVPVVVADLSATRRGNAVELRFTVPQRTTDGVALRQPSVTTRYCRAVDAGPCRPLASAPPQAFPINPGGPPQLAELRDVLPAELAAGAPHLLAYRVELTNSRGRSAGPSDPAYAAAGSAPEAVEGLHAQGSHLGVVLAWKAASEGGGTVLLRREDLHPAEKAVKKTASHGPETGSKLPARAARQGSKYVLTPFGTAGDDEPAVVWLDAATEGNSSTTSNSSGSTVDTSAVPEVPYRYTAERRRTVQLAGRTFELHSEVSAPVEFTLDDVFPPPVPTELSAAGYMTQATADSPAAFAVDLIWTPVEDQHLAGYNVYRQALDATGAPAATSERLNTKPVDLPAFHDKTASSAQRYRYNVTSVDSKGDESAPAVTTLEPTGQ